MRGARKINNSPPEPRSKSQRRPKANTNEILNSGGAPVQPEKIDPRWQRHYDILVDLRNHFQDEGRVLRDEAAEEYTGPKRNDADVATNTYDRDWALGMLSSEQDAVYEIDEALERIRNGTYGKCELSGKAIPEERLNAIPWTRFTAEAEREIERSGGSERTKTKLGRLDTVPKERKTEGFDRQS
jgi:RNA polymerase-binding transcription factor DksA